jgi:hypothetical protein
LLSLKQAKINSSAFNNDRAYPFNLKPWHFEHAMRTVYDFFDGVNNRLVNDLSLERLEDILRPANLSGMLSDMFTDALASASGGILTTNLYHNGHPDLIVKGRYPDNAVQAGEDGIEVKATRKQGGAVDSHGARNQTLCTFVYDIDNDRRKPVWEREPLIFREVYLATVAESDFRRNERGTLGTRTATLDREGIRKFRQGWVYLDRPPAVTNRMRRAGPWRQA